MEVLKQSPCPFVSAEVINKKPKIEQDVIEGRISATMAVKSLIEVFEGH
ncbi:hypothetical protein [Pelosinus fermentans]|nr:hypothetical protein [Pelosinus fermentans]